MNVLNARSASFSEADFVRDENELIKKYHRNLSLPLEDQIEEGEFPASTYLPGHLQSDVNEKRRNVSIRSMSDNCLDLNAASTQNQHANALRRSDSDKSSLLSAPTIAGGIDCATNQKLRNMKKSCARSMNRISKQEMQNLQGGKRNLHRSQASYASHQVARKQISSRMGQELNQLSFGCTPKRRGEASLNAIPPSRNTSRRRIRGRSKTTPSVEKEVVGEELSDKSNCEKQNQKISKVKVDQHVHYASPRIQNRLRLQSRNSGRIETDSDCASESSNDSQKQSKDVCSKNSEIKLNEKDKELAMFLSDIKATHVVVKSEKSVVSDTETNNIQPKRSKKLLDKDAPRRIARKLSKSIRGARDSKILRPNTVSAKVA